MTRSCPFSLLTLAALAVACGRDGPQGSNQMNTNRPTPGLAASLETVSGAGVFISFTKNERLSTSVINYEGAKQILVNVAGSQHEPESEIWVTTFPCRVEKTDVITFEADLQDITHKLLTEGIEKGQFQLNADPGYAIQTVPKLADSGLMKGFYFDYARKYHADRAERLVVLGDMLDDSGKCIRIKAGSQKFQSINPSTLLGRTLIELQSSASFAPFSRS
jgi:hypothetical protein